MNGFEIVLRLLLSLTLAGTIGYEREKNHSNAGLKTHMLVGIASTIVGLISSEIIYGAKEVVEKYPILTSIYGADPARLPAAVISGVGFLGAGTILVTKRNVSGLTTAASIWAVSSMGLALGLGYYKIGIIGALFIMLILVVVKKFLGLRSNKQVSIFYSEKEVGKDIGKLLKKYSIEYRIIHYTVVEDNEKLTYMKMYEFLSVQNITFNKVFDELIILDNIIEIKELSV
ncbi:MgtC/SapB family protein [Gemella cuniculi]|uniref:MgtC/SapB family protein n=1 Tax=Gemella cuniculi TaxID=150240 RepID=UPI0003FAE014|nr:MgtC/SapB family protein [Gemella cuniculi]